MRFWLFGDIGEYAHEVVKKVLAPYLVQDVREADVVLLSLCDITEIGLIQKAREVAGGRPVMVGGGVAQIPIVNELADYTWHGEVFGFRQLLDMDVALCDMPNISTPKKRKAVVSSDIDFGACPVVTRGGGKAAYWYLSKGCKMRCSYCLMAHTRDMRCASLEQYVRVDSACAARKKNLFPIGCYDPYINHAKCRRSISEVLMLRYVQDSHADVSSRIQTIRTAVEVVDPVLGKALAKGVSKDVWSRFITIAKQRGNKAIVYYLAGLETDEALLDFICSCEAGFDRTPDVNMSFTYIDPQPHTPFYDFDIRRKRRNDFGKIFRQSNLHNSRFSLNRSNIDNSTYRTFLQRIVDVGDLGRIKRSWTHEKMLEAMHAINPKLLGSSSLEDIAARDRRESWLWKTVLPYWDAA